MAANNTGSPAPLPGWNELDLTPVIGEEALARLLTAGNEPSTLLYGAAGSGKTSLTVGTSPVLNS